MTLPDGDRQAVDTLTEAYQQIIRELGKVIVGQQQVIEQLLCRHVCAWTLPAWSAFPAWPKR